MYTVGFLYLVGAGLLSSSWIVGVLIPTLSFTVLVWLRIQDEEQMLCDFSTEYASYIERTGRFFPKTVTVDRFQSLMFITYKKSFKRSCNWEIENGLFNIGRPACI